MTLWNVAQAEELFCRDGDHGGDREEISWRVHPGGRGGEELTSRECCEMGRFRVDPNRGFPSAPAVHLFRTAEYTPAGVGIRAAGHPWHRRRLDPSR